MNITCLLCMKKGRICNRCEKIIDVDKKLAKREREAYEAVVKMVDIGGLTPEEAINYLRKALYS